MPFRYWNHRKRRKCPVFAEEEFPSEDMDDITEEVSIKAEEVPTKPELKVAFNTKNSDNQRIGRRLSLLQSSRTVQDQDQAARDEEEETEELVDSATAEDGVEESVPG